MHKYMYFILLFLFFFYLFKLDAKFNKSWPTVFTQYIIIIIIMLID